MSEELLQMILDEAEEKMLESVAYVRREFGTVRTGRASSSIVERLTVEAWRGNADAGTRNLFCA